MDIEQLKIIVETISTLGVEGKEVFFLWLLASKAPAILFGLIWTGIGVVALRVGHKLLQSVLVGEKLREAAGVTVCWSRHEAHRAEAILREHFQEKKKGERS